LQSGRLERKSAAGLEFIDDSYNANPDSMKAALKTLESLHCAGRRIAVLGRMGELGSYASEGHVMVGRAARNSGIDFLVTVGDDDSLLIHQSFGDSAKSRHFPTHADAAEFLRATANRNDLILVKGSRSAAMEKVIAGLTDCEPASASH
jgi:UDP-N-acetylmuramyl pentapeptide synthase